MIIVNIHEAKTKLSALLSALEKRGEWVRICRNGNPVADLRPVTRAKNSLAQDPKLKVLLKEDPVLPLDEDDWPAKEDF